MGSLSDQELVRKAQAGDKHAFDQLVERHADRAYSFAYRLLGDRDDAWEAFVDATVRLWTRLSDLRDPAKAAPFFKSCIYNVCRETWKRRRREQQHIGFVGLPPDHSPDFDPSGEGAFERLWVHDALTKLTFRQRTVLVLKYLDEHTYTEIAEIMRTSADNVKYHLRQARENMRVHLKQPQSGAE